MIFDDCSRVLDPRKGGGLSGGLLPAAQSEGEMYGPSVCVQSWLSLRPLERDTWPYGRWNLLEFMCCKAVRLLVRHAE